MNQEGTSSNVTFDIVVGQQINYGGFLVLKISEE